MTGNDSRWQLGGKIAVKAPLSAYQVAMARLRKINGRYYAYFYERHRETKSKSYPLGVSNKDSAQKMLRRLEAEYAEGLFDPWSPTPVSYADKTYGEAADAFVASRKSLRPATISNYKWFIEDCRRALRLAKSSPIERLNAKALQPYLYDDNTVSKATLATRYRHIKAFYRWCKQNGLLKHDPFESLKKPKARRPVRDYVRPEQIDQLLACIDQYQPAGGVTVDSQWIADIVTVAVGTGLRRRELCYLTWPDVDLKDQRITARSTKSGHHRTVDIFGSALEVIGRRDKNKAHDTFVFVGPTGEPITSTDAMQRLSRGFKFFVRKAGLPEWIRFHDLRHATASWLVSDGVPLRVVQDIMGQQNKQ